MNLFDITNEKACMVKMPGKNRDEILREIARRAAKTVAMNRISEQEIFDKLLAREEQGSTGFGNGVAIPHARFANAEDFVFFIVTSNKAIDFQALDRKKVQVFFVLLGPEDRIREHLQILAAISNIVTHTNVRRELLSASTGSALYEIFLSKIREESRPRTVEKMKLLFIVLYEDDFFYDILELFVQEGVEGATIIDSTGMGQFISNIPLFASFIGFMNEQLNQSRTIIATVPEGQLDDIVSGIENITGDLDKRQGAMIIALDVAYSKGTMKMV